MKGFINVRAYLHGRGIIRTSIGLENGKIAYIGDSADAIEPICECPGILVPGFIDEHIHGAGGADVMDGTPAAIDTLSRKLAEEGTTSFLATTMTQSHSAILRAVANAAHADCTGGARCLGIHLEGPFIAKDYRGAQPAEYAKEPSREVFESLSGAAENRVRLVTLAPELRGAADLIRTIVKSGAVASVGHSAADYEDILAAEEAGLTCVTHTFNAQSPFRHRQIGVVGAALSEDALYCEVICDGIHVSYPAIRLLLKNKPEGKVILITDAMRAKGIGDGTSELGGQTVVIKDGQARLADGTLAGSVLKMNEAVRNLVAEAGASFEYAVDCATLNPARNLGIADEYGSIAVGKYADLTALDADYRVLFTVVGGTVVYDPANLARG